MTISPVDHAPADHASLHLAEHRRSRIAAATARRGPASFVWGAFVTRPGTTVHAAPGVWAPLPDGEAGLRVSATTADGIRIGGVVVDGDAILYHDESVGPAVAEFPGGAEGILFTYDASKYALQVWDPGSEWARSFGGISAYDYDPGWIVDAEVRLIESDRTVAISHHRDPRPVDMPVVAEAKFVHDGREQQLLGIGGPDPAGLALLFTDATSGSESYAAGRVVELHERRDGAVRLDFNYASLLPCAFSLAWNCPIPPAENRLSIPVRAGERHAVRRDGENLL